MTKSTNIHENQFKEHIHKAGGVTQHLTASSAHTCTTRARTHTEHKIHSNYLGSKVVK